jgi:hypothetical protein
MMLDLFAENLHLGVVKVLVRRAGLNVVDQHLGAVMLDDGFIEQIVLDLAADGRIENLLLDHGMDLQLGADLPRQLLLARRTFRLGECGEELLHLAMVRLQHGDGVGKVLLEHGFLPRNGFATQRTGSGPYPSPKEG